MTRAQHALARRWRGLALVAVLLALAGGVSLSLLLIRQEADLRGQAMTEADLRGEAVSTLATDVRELRAQLQAEGETPKAPDPTDAVEDLPDRAEVPVPIPGPPGPAGPAGSPGSDGSDGDDGFGATGSPGAVGPTGAAGTSGTDGAAGPPGPAGPQGELGPAGSQGPAGEDGADGRDGTDGQDGQTCPDEYSLQPPPDDPDALVCRRDGAPDPEPSPNGLIGLAALAGTAAYRRL